MISNIFFATFDTDGTTYYRYLNGIGLIARNLVCAPHAGCLAWKEATGIQAFNIAERLLAKKNLAHPFEDKVLATMLQLLANMAREAATSDEFIPVLGYITNKMGKDGIQGLNRQLLSAGPNAFSILLIIENAIALNSKEVLPLLSDSENGRTLLLSILEAAEHWYSSEECHHIVESLHNIFNSIVLNGLAPHFINEFLSQSRPDQFATLVKLIDASVEDLLQKKAISRDLQTELAESTIPVLEKVATKCAPYIKESKENKKRDDEDKMKIRGLWSQLAVLLDTLQAIVEHDENEQSITKQALLKNTNVVNGVVDLLVLAQDYLPQRSKLKDIEEMHGINPGTYSTSDKEMDAQEFPLIKGKLISIISILAKGELAVQDAVRERKGLAAVLSNCIVDSNNPFIKERAIVCIRYLLQGNDKNQALVASLEAKETVNPDVLKDAGYEAEVIDGKFKLKKLAKQS
ncbi:hypothetical protein TRVA0_049S00606 [Trichomonascus vanleenenianus]|uniref:Ctr86p n=1 Tax=Trichomonascus vanleenenianus TaxID=2268995 RepID=UPI003ECAB426